MSSDRILLHDDQHILLIVLDELRFLVREAEKQNNQTLTARYQEMEKDLREYMQAIDLIPTEDRVIIDYLGLP